MRHRRSYENSGRDVQMRFRCLAGCQAMPNVEVQLISKMPGFLIPTRVERHAAQALTLCRYTPARYRFDAAAAYNTNQVTPNMGSCPQIRLIWSIWGLFASIHRRPIVCREIRSHQGKSMHLSPRHSSRTCRIPPECTCLLVQSTASLQPLRCW
jgi:hypothetical protein